MSFSKHSYLNNVDNIKKNFQALVSMGFLAVWELSIELLTDKFVDYFNVVNYTFLLKFEGIFVLYLKGWTQ